MYIKTCNLVVSMTIRIHSPSLHNKVDSGSCHGDRLRNFILLSVLRVCLVRGGTAAFTSCKQGRLSNRRCMWIPNAASRGSSFSA
jgi:hypothetical protein